MIRTSNPTVERRHCGATELYIALDDLNFAWLEDEVATVITMYSAGCPVWEIAEKLGRPQEEVALLIMDLSRKKAIEPRRHGVYGRREKRG